MTETNLPIATVVLVHAAWADASSWNKIIPPLQRRGLQAVAVQIPLISLSDDAATLRRFLKKVSGLGFERLDKELKRNNLPLNGLGEQNWPPEPDQWVLEA